MYKAGPADAAATRAVPHDALRRVFD